jgi:hypothetical protein
LPLPQVKKIYATLAPRSVSQLLLPYIKQALTAASDNSNNINGHDGHSSSSPFMRHRRSFTSASSLSTMSRASGNASGGDNLLGKFVLMHPGGSDKRCQEALNNLKSDICKTFLDNDTISKDLAETDFETLFPRLDVSECHSIHSATIAMFHRLYVFHAANPACNFPKILTVSKSMVCTAY